MAYYIFIITYHLPINSDFCQGVTFNPNITVLIFRLLYYGIYNANCSVISHHVSIHFIISPSLWRDFFRPRYKHQFELAHMYGLDVYFHSCGYIYDIIPDLIDIGVDLLNLGQPNSGVIKEGLSSI